MPWLSSDRAQAAVGNATVDVVPDARWYNGKVVGEPKSTAHVAGCFDTSGAVLTSAVLQTAQGVRETHRPMGRTPPSA